MTTLTVSKRGTVTIPPSVRKRLGLEGMDNALLVLEEREGGIFLQPAVATPVRDFPLETIQGWIREDEAAMAALRARSPRKRR